MKQQIIEGEDYSVSMDDHCLLVKVNERKIWLSRKMCSWILNNYDKIDFENNLIIE